MDRQETDFDPIKVLEDAGIDPYDTGVGAREKKEGKLDSSTAEIELGDTSTKGGTLTSSSGESSRPTSSQYSSPPAYSSGGSSGRSAMSNDGCCDDFMKEVSLRPDIQELCEDEEVCIWGSTCFVCCILIIAASVFGASFYDVSQSQYAIRYDILTRKYDDEVYEEGKHLFAPETKMFLYAKKVDKTEYDTDCLSRDGIVIGMTVQFQYQLSKVELLTLFKEYGAYARYEKYLEMISRDSALDTCSQFNATDFYTKRGVITATMRDNMAYDFNLSQVHSSLITVELSNYEFPTELTSAIEDKQQAEQDIEKARNEREGALTSAQTVLLSAQVEADQKIIQAEAEVSSILAEAEAQSDAISQLWDNRRAVYVDLMVAMDMTVDEFVEEYLKADILNNAVKPVSRM